MMALIIGDLQCLMPAQAMTERRSFEPVMP